MNESHLMQAWQLGFPDRHTALAAVLDAMELDPIRREEGAGRSERQWCSTHVNCRIISVYTFFPSPYAKLADLDDTIKERYTVATGSQCRSEVPDARTHTGYEEDNTFYLEFRTLEEAVCFCLDDPYAPMEIALHRTQQAVPHP